jgi:hypothetical protein
MPARKPIGARKGVASMSPFDRAPVDFWLFIGVALIMFGLSVAIIYSAM